VTALDLYGGRLIDAGAAEEREVLLPEGPRVTWKPLSGSQTLVLSYGGNIVLHHGTRGPGKTDGQLMAFRRYVGIGYGAYWRGVIFDREYKNLDDLVSKSMRWFPHIGGPEDKPRFLSSKSDYKWVWPTGEELAFRTIKKITDYWNFHGQEYPFIGWNELTKYPTDELFDMMMSCNRSGFVPKEQPLTIDGDVYNATGQIKFVGSRDSRARVYILPELPLRVHATCNPHGPGHNWVKKRFINAARPGQIVHKKTNVFNPRSGKREDVVKTQVHIFGSYRENKYLSPEYVAELENITDKNKRKAWLGGSWDIVSGAMFDDVWDSDYHKLKPFEIPHNWRLDRSFDWGSSKPASVGWWAESDGSDVQLPDGTWKSTVRGDIFRIAEWYLTTGKPNQGLNMLANDVAAGIVERELAMGIYGRVKPGPADTSIWDVENGNSIAADMAKPVRVKGKVMKGISWTRADKSPGSRKSGWLRVRVYLQKALPAFIQGRDGKPVRIPREHPGMYIFDTCTYFFDLFPTLPRDEKDPDDVDTSAEDHIGDEVRYRVLSAITGARSGRTTGT
jgi:hypothetical protein